MNKYLAEVEVRLFLAVAASSQHEEKVSTSTTLQKPTKLNLLGQTMSLSVHFYIKTCFMSPIQNVCTLKSA